ncbi:DNA polymerase Y family protein [Actinocatenispora sera]|uniref:DNA polymerase Y family protein n=1 Tax=Actinocatenispora sera TaxID=390989 RepID=UPI0033EB7452
MDPIRTLVLWCPDWPVAAAFTDHRDAGIELAEHRPVAVVDAGTVIACSQLARAEGVRRGQRRRDAQACCPELIVVPHDPVRDVRVFEPVADAVAELAAGVEVVRPGVAALAARGPAGYFGGEATAAERLVDHVATSCEVEAQVGIADGVFAATLAARAGVLVEPGDTPAFLAELDVRVLARPELVGLLRRLGIRTLGAFAALPAGDVLARFGFDAAVAHRLATGREQRLLAPRSVPPELSVREEFDDPVARVDTAAFLARSLAERLHERLAAHGLGATRLTIIAGTGNGEQLERTWRHDGLLGPGELADRLRWQLEGWLTRADRPTAGVTTLCLVPDGLVEHAGFQRRLWGEPGDEGADARRSITHVQGLLGPAGVLAAVLGGGRSPTELPRQVPFGDERVPALPPAPWPGRLPTPAPADVAAAGATVLAADGVPVGVTGRHQITASPATVAVGTGAPAAVLSWAGPWPAEERWWQPGEAQRLARIQVSLADGRALLLARSDGHWRVEASYD